MRLEEIVKQASDGKYINFINTSVMVLLYCCQLRYVQYAHQVTCKCQLFWLFWRKLQNKHLNFLNEKKRLLVQNILISLLCTSLPIILFYMHVKLYYVSTFYTIIMWLVDQIAKHASDERTSWQTNRPPNRRLDGQRQSSIPSWHCRVRFYYFSSVEIYHGA